MVTSSFSSFFVRLLMYSCFFIVVCFLGVFRSFVVFWLRGFGLLLVCGVWFGRSSCLVC